ncbi:MULTISPECIES: hypothetical protein [Turicibacter]|nr:hypothetical protein [Turicibacter sp. H121]MCU7199829.1 hypothetical protein [Turicibacter sp. H121]MDD5984875.1 hypothetical protein [Turicibacter sp.]MDD6760770.1 hypothetical protein [Turicibacter sp.]CUN47431.1 Uncharacterised protein [Turicibacter sanguinis]
MNKELFECSLCSELYEAWADAFNETESRSEHEDKENLKDPGHDGDNN